MPIIQHWCHGSKDNSWGERYISAAALSSSWLPGWTSKIAGVVGQNSSVDIQDVRGSRDNSLFPWFNYTLKLFFSVFLLCIPALRYPRSDTNTCLWLWREDLSHSVAMDYFWQLSRVPKPSTLSLFIFLHIFSAEHRLKKVSGAIIYAYISEGRVWTWIHIFLMFFHVSRLDADYSLWQTSPFPSYVILLIGRTRSMAES